MPADRITRLSIEGMRCIESIELDLRELTVLIGENGTGKSTILEALEILRKAAAESPLIAKLYDAHDGTRLLRQGCRQLGVTVGIAGDGPELTYTLRVLRDGTYLSVAHEEIVEAGSKVAMRRAGADYTFAAEDGTTARKEGAALSDETVIAHARFLKIPQLVRAQRALASIEVYVPLDLRRTWSSTQAPQTARSSNLARPTDRVEPGGTNLVNVYAALKNQRDWKETLGRLRVSLGEVEDVLLVSEPSGGTQTIWIRWENGTEIPLSGLSDGQISMLALVAIQQLRRPMPPSVVAIDEPEVHLHPGLIARVAAGLQEMAEEIPIIVGTQSDAFLNAIERPEGAVVLCQLDHQRRTELLRPDPDQLRAWLGEFKGLGTVRSEGLQSVVFPASP
jgi:predicted ATPase